MFIQTALKGIAYSKARLAEKSTWAAIATAIPSGALLPTTWAAFFIIASVIVALAPEPKRKRKEPPDAV